MDGRVAMNLGSIVKLFSAGWHVAQVRPLPPNFSLKKRFAPWAIRGSVLLKGESAKATRGPKKEARRAVGRGRACSWLARV